MAANFREKRTSITTMGAKTQPFASFPTPLVSHYPLPLSSLFLAWGFTVFTAAIIYDVI
jgi:hypothetical protein